MNSPIEPTLQVAALGALENAIQLALHLDPGSAQSLQALGESVFLIRCTEPELDVFVHIQDGQIYLHSLWESKITTTLSGPASEYASLLNTEDRGSALVNSGLSMQGDSAALITLQDILSTLELDWEGQLAKLLGNTPAHFLGQTGRQLASLGQQARTTLLRYLEEYLLEEARLLPTRQEVAVFTDDVGQLDRDVDRLNRHIEKLKKSIKNI